MEAFPGFTRDPCLRAKITSAGRPLGLLHDP